MADEYEGEHVLILSASGFEWEAGCSCGWGPDEDFPDEDAAIDAWENHCDVVFMEATFEDHNVRGFG